MTPKQIEPYITHAEVNNDTALFHVRQKRKPSNGKGIRQEKPVCFGADSMQ